MFGKSSYHRSTSTLVFTVLLISALLIDSTATASQMNDKVAQLNFDTATLDDVLAIFGEPTVYKCGDQTVKRSDLPLPFYSLWYPDSFFIEMSWNSVRELRFESAALGYVWTGGIQVGSPLNAVLNVVGQPTRIIEGQPMPNMFNDNFLYKDINGVTGFCYYCRSDWNVRFFFWDYEVSGLYLTGNVLSSPKPVNEFDDVRWRNLSSFDFSDRPGLIATLRFNLDTMWPEPDKMPPASDPNQILTNAMNPGLGVRALHQQGITGKGVNVAIIDQGMYLDHPEFAGKLASYYDLASARKGSMHGPAVTSLLVGDKCGTSPDARVFYAACRDGVYEVDYAQALNWIVDRSQALPPSGKIRVVSVSAAPGVSGVPSGPGQQTWNDACARAEAAGILVLDCTGHHGFIGRCWYDAADPDNPAKCTPGVPGGSASFSPSMIYAPASVRTTAEHYNPGDFGYQYCGRAGLSWSIPYCAGVLAMGCQLRPDFTADQMRNLLFQSAYINPDGAKIINPQEFIRLVTAIPRTISVGKDPQYDYSRIQDAIDAANNGDTIIVQPGGYEENIDLGGKNITLRSAEPNNPATAASTIINGSVHFAGTEDPSCTLAGFKVTGIIRGSTGQDHTHANINHCLLTGNGVEAGTVITYCDGTINNCLIADNYTICYCVGPAIEGCHGVIKNCTVANNHLGLGVLAAGATTVENSIIYHNGDFWPEVTLGSGATLSISYSDIQGGPTGIEPEDPCDYAVSWGPGNIAQDPCFARLGRWVEMLLVEGDYHLQSARGRWDPNQNNWVHDAHTSRCIDAGNPACPLRYEPDDANNLRINMGAYGGTGQASTPPPNWALLADLTNDGHVNLEDYAIQAADRLNYEYHRPGDLNRDRLIDLADLALLCQDWLKTTPWHK